jgi:hypothetical protein
VIVQSRKKSKLEFVYFLPERAGVGHSADLVPS